MTGARVVWGGAGSLVAVAMLGFGTLNAVTALAHEQEHVVAVFDAAGVTALDVRGEGHVTVVGADVAEITVTMRLSHGLRRTGHTEEVVGGTLVLDVDCPGLLSHFCEVDHTVEVPRGLDVWIDNANGSTDVAGLAGSLDVDGDNGRITGRDLRTPVLRVSNDNGAIDLVVVEAPDRVAVDNDNGAIELTVPHVDEGYAVETQNDNGSIDVQVRTDPTSPRSISAENDNGSIELRAG
jgi:hypothetical protein